MNETRLGNRLKDARTEAGLTQAELALKELLVLKAELVLLAEPARKA